MKENTLEITLKSRAIQWASLILRQMFLTATFMSLDFWLRYKTRSIGLYSITELAPNLLTLLWSVMLGCIVTVIPSRRGGRIAYGLLYYVYLIYTVVQYGVYLVLGRFVYVTDMLLAGEGADYAAWVVEFIKPELIVQLLALVAFGVLGIVFFPKKPEKTRPAVLIRGVAALLCALGISQAALLYGEVKTDDHWDNFMSASFEYERFANSNFGMQITGVYQFLNRDLQVQLRRQFADSSESVEEINAFFAERPGHQDNELTGLLKGKNVIIVMMESIDDWLVTPEVMPTLYRMSNEGIHFTNLYTPDYASGYTFNTEFAFNLGIYPYSNGSVSYSLTRNDFPYSLANTFSDAGYAANSFHEGDPSFYNRGQMHQTFGYETYHCYREYPWSGISYYDDTFLPKTDALYQQVVAGEPFCSFVITYSAHLPYANDDLTVYAREHYPMFNDIDDPELPGLYAKARMTDEMLRLILERLEQDGILDDTVLVCYSDHYTYGLSDKELLQQKSEEAGNPILENTPALIYWSGLEQGIKVDKVCQTVDLAPTVMNLFGLEVPDNIMGRDILDEGYEGYAIFPYTTWITENAYCKYGQIQWNNGMTQEQIEEMNAFVHRYYYVNDAILDSDYYANQN